MAWPLTRRGFLFAAGSGALLSPLGSVPAFSEPLKVSFKKQSPFEPLYAKIDPAADVFVSEKEALAIHDALSRLQSGGSVPVTPSCQGLSPVPARYRSIAADVFEAEFSAAPAAFPAALDAWRASLEQIERLSFFPLAQGLIRYEVQGRESTGLYYRVGHWQTEWQEGKLHRLTPRDEIKVTAAEPWFEDVTSALFGASPAFRDQLRFGIPYWRAALDSATGIDVYGTNGIAVGDVDSDGWEEIYVCQPGGLPNRLFRRTKTGVFEDITEAAGVGVLDDTASALFLDLRNLGRQDLVVLTSQGPLLFLNDGKGRFQFKEQAFRSASAPQGSFTGMAAADYNRDGKLDLYLCTYVYFQSEDQYRYPAPYHDARNGPANFLFENRLTPDGGGWFEDVTQASGLSQNNDRFSFAPAWCDCDGDGWPDLYVANDFGRNNLYRNENGRFRDVAAEAGVEDIGPGMSAAWFDSSGDGRPDLYVTNMWSPAGQRLAHDPAFSPVAEHKLTEEYRRHAKGNSLYRNQTDGRFSEVTAEQGVGMGRWSWAGDAADLDLDGQPELYVAAGMLTNSSSKDLMSFFWRQVVAQSPPALQPAPAYENGWNAINQLIREDWSWNGNENNVFYARRQGQYYDFSGVSGAGWAADSRAFAFVDFDNDGCPDLIVKNRLGPQIRALRNRTASGKPSLVVELIGVESNRDAIGAKLELTAGGRAQTRWISAGSGYLSQHSRRQIFGAPAPASLHIVWPSGKTQEVSGLSSGFRYRITEGKLAPEKIPLATREPLPAPSSLPDQDVLNRPPSRPVWLYEPAPLPVRLDGPALVVLYSGDRPLISSGIPVRFLDLAADPDLAAGFSLFRRYLLDYRAPLEVPSAFLIGADGQARRFYPGLQDPALVRQDLASLDKPASAALPFPGRYYSPPSRNFFRWGAAFFYAGYDSFALQYLTEVVRRNPQNAKALLATGQILLEAGKPAEARAHLEKAAALTPGSPEVWNNLGGVAMAQGDYRTAVTHFEKALSLNPDLVFALVNAGQAYSRLNDNSSAEKYLRRAIEIGEPDADVADQLGLILARSGRTTEAKSWFQKALALDRAHASAINNLGVLYMMTGEPNEAIAAFRYGISVAPRSERLYQNLASLYLRQGRRDRARAVLEQLLEVDPSSELAQKGLLELNRQ